MCMYVCVFRGGGEGGGGECVRVCVRACACVWAACMWMGVRAGGLGRGILYMFGKQPRLFLFFFYFKKIYLQQDARSA
jgi:hypothetical protein